MSFSRPCSFFCCFPGVEFCALDCAIPGGKFCASIIPSLVQTILCPRLCFSWYKKICTLDCAFPGVKFCVLDCAFPGGKFCDLDVLLLENCVLSIVLFVVSNFVLSTVLFAGKNSCSRLCFLLEKIRALDCVFCWKNCVLSIVLFLVGNFVLSILIFLVGNFCALDCWEIVCSLCFSLEILCSRLRFSWWEMCVLSIVGKLCAPCAFRCKT